jgi:hypothetical protein
MCSSKLLLFTFYILFTLELHPRRSFQHGWNSPKLPNLSTETLLQIFSYLDPVHSTCLGLVCRNLYEIHFSKHKNIPLDAFTYDCPGSKSHLSTMCYLFNHLQDWKPADLIHCWRCHKFCKSNSAAQSGPLLGKCDTCARHEHEISQYRVSLWQRSIQTRQLAPPPQTPRTS